MNYYNILGIQNNSSQEQIKIAFRNLAKMHHPDKNPQSVQFRIISEAYRILSNPQLRARYDQAQQQYEKQLQIYKLIRNFINGNGEIPLIHQKDFESNQNESKTVDIQQIQKKKIRKTQN
ncbi:unnamed protein product [Paramecium primaurelia]|uniref:J domain-containing protein n=1 Tax=Paramecium primaurelia TaxID=5886 RepID=A0A8S1P8N6_PARPR|nr:unnamed protein product [Paramecium primaurelia]